MHLTQGHEVVGGLLVGEVEEKPASIGGAAYLLQGLAIGLDPVVDLTPLPAAPLPLTDMMMMMFITDTILRPETPSSRP